VLKEQFQMAFTRKALSSIEGLTATQIDTIMNLHGTSMAGYQLKSEFNDAVKAEVDKQVGEQKKQFEGVDLETLKTQAAQAEKLQSELEKTKLNYTIENRLIKEGAVNAKAVSALLDPSKIKVEDGEVKGIDEQVTALKESQPWAFPQQTPKAGGLRQGKEQPQITGVEAEFLKRNPGLKID
jgi:hypothetical protein